MLVWRENLKRFFQQKEVLLLHGNVRDTAYINENGSLTSGFTNLISEIAKECGFQRGIFWGVVFDKEGTGHSPMWSLERIEYFDGSRKPEIRTTESDAREIIVLTRWLREEMKDITQKTVFVINYIDKLTPYSQRGLYPENIAILVTLVQKIIENIPPSHRLVMVALQDTMVPLEYYTNSPKVAVMEIPIPDKFARQIYFTTNLSSMGFKPEHIDFLANITDGLYVKDLENIVRALREQFRDESQISISALRKVVNRYRIGTEQDPWATLPLSGPPKGLLDSAESWFKKDVIGQDHAIEEIVKSLKKARAGVVGLASGQQSKPKAVFLFAGPTGVGKTFLAKKLAEYLFDTEEAFIRIDMSEFKEEHTVSKLIGAPPGYVGYEKGGVLTNAVQARPFSVILFDEIEKAHPKIMDIFLQILDDGRLTDSRGQTVFFTESVIIFTSNIGTRTYLTNGRPCNERKELEKILAEDIPEEEKARKIREHFIKSVQEFFTYEISRPELLNRIGPNIIAFNYISTDEYIRSIIRSKLNGISENFRDRFSNQNYRLSFSEEVIDYFFNKHKDSIKRFGGRGLVNAVENEVGHIIAEQVLYAELGNEKNVNFSVYVNEGNLRCRREVFTSAQI
jgi:ATP-dependent Clp protease ATP-binding subunit ClpA